MELTSIERIDARDIAAFERQHSTLDRPVILAGAAADWPVMSKLQLCELKGTLGSVKVPVRRTDDEFEVFFHSRVQDAGRRQMVSLGEYVAAIESAGDRSERPLYAGNIAILRDPAVSARLGSIAAECRFPKLRIASSSMEYRLWIGAQGQRSTIHNDPYHNFNAQIVGSKRFIAFSPDQHRALYPVFFHREMWASPIDPTKPDLAQYPAFARACGAEGILCPGDILFLPRFWWHCVDAITTCVNINQWVYSESYPQCWHEQPEARRFISYEDLLEQQRRKFESLSEELREYYVDDFSRLQADLARFI